MNKQLYLLLVPEEEIFLVLKTWTTKFLDEEIEEDKMFWNQEALKEEEEDDNYEVELKVTDLFDNDFVKDVSSLLPRLKLFTLISSFLAFQRKYVSSNYLYRFVCAIDWELSCDYFELTSTDLCISFDYVFYKIAYP
ncbi:uncharacterized protein LOC112190771 isoform X1 [Rosa chinensis]|uniref:uncharacterized protein LOC112190771 isoform X1 n=1 Tax=Rosa chinensis TaxID=74649 RepID=UPI001AD94C3C|nr:uncharacterized protein LOC112190771 isoform X1 [Rosa chinensis]XP_040370832.1 uncharacterized protein LOC112190771 isoform X1 [Rosa chinensis]XP_040370833.1 uncharacterized protein LOC112190771 isoform X1 [Rosa chinensis]